MTNTPTPEQVAEALKVELHIAPEGVAAIVRRLRDACRGGDKCKCSLSDAATVIEALAADRDAQKARAEAAEQDRKMYHEAAKRHRDEVQRLLFDVVPAAEAKVARLVEYYEAAEAFTAEKTTGNGTRLVRARAAIAEVQE